MAKITIHEVRKSGQGISLTGRRLYVDLCCPLQSIPVWVQFLLEREKRPLTEIYMFQEDVDKAAKLSDDEFKLDPKRKKGVQSIADDE